MSNNVAGVSGGSKRIKNFFIIFEKKYFFEKKFSKFFGSGGGELGGDPPPRGGEAFGISSLSSGLKTFYDHLQCSQDNLKKIDFVAFKNSPSAAF